MASEVPEYFLPRNWDYPPGGPIKLGNVLASLKEPHRPLATLQPDANSIIKSRKSLAAIETEDGRSGGVTVMTTFLSALLGAGVDVAVNVERSTGRTFTFDDLETNYIDTTDDHSANAELSQYEAYIERCANAPAVLRYLERSRFRKEFYVITGLKTVSGAKCLTTATNSTDGLAGAQVDGTILTGGTIPVGGGLEVHGGRSKKSKASWEGSTDFVLAFKVSRVTVSRSGKIKKEEEYLKGAFLELSPTKSRPHDLTISHECQLIDENTFSPFTVAEGEDRVTFGVRKDD